MADILVFNKYNTYAIELKRDFKINPIKQLQVLEALKYKDDLIYLFLDNTNFNFITKHLINNDKEILKHYGKVQINFWMEYYKRKKRKENETTL
ncbi:hypothetical protein [Mesomycoplasma molare]|uniref:Uncharacterized protein n=1 Tax=Mesomycoplasma molare TaxID=171288 RepID=A0ABY5TTX6_9BACT|nr:hypothetical protein [Mesomycoplasma molare]UWD34035.1 hypothetical protein NX772_02930 [Mesomycoplasma molare]